MARTRAEVQPALPRLAIVGCGAAAREFCLPVLSRHPGFSTSVVVVDRLPAQAEAVAAEFGIQHWCTDYTNLPIEVDAAIVTTPHHLHAEQSIHFLQQQKHVLVEKPLGMSEAETARMCAATSGSAVLMVNNYRRLFPAYDRVREVLHSGKYGKLVRVQIFDGTKFAWKSVSAFYLRDAQVARGVFLDRGAHTIDILCSWLSGVPEVISAKYDAFGGAEALMDVQLTYRDAPIHLLFSRLFRLENCYRIECEKAQIWGRLFDVARFQILREGRAETITAGRPQLYYEYGWKLIENFIAVVQGRQRPLFIAEDVAPSISVIEKAYQKAVPFECPWYENDPNISWMRAGAASSNGFPDQLT